MSVTKTTRSCTNNFIVVFKTSSVVKNKVSSHLCAIKPRAIACKWHVQFAECSTQRKLVGNTGWCSLQVQRDKLNQFIISVCTLWLACSFCTCDLLRRKRLDFAQLPNAYCGYITIYTCRNYGLSPLKTVDGHNRDGQNYDSQNRDSQNRNLVLLTPSLDGRQPDS